MTKKSIFKRIIAGIGTLALIGSMMPAMTAQAGAREWTLVLPDDTDSLSFALVENSLANGTAEQITGKNEWIIKDADTSPQKLRFTITKDNGYDWAAGATGAHAGSDLTITPNTESATGTETTYTWEESGAGVITNGGSLSINIGANFVTTRKAGAVIVMTAAGAWNDNKQTTGIAAPDNNYTIEWTGSNMSSPKTLRPVNGATVTVANASPTASFVKSSGDATFTLKAGNGATVKDAVVSYATYDNTLANLDATTDPHNAATVAPLVDADYVITPDAEGVYTIPAAKVGSNAAYIIINVNNVTAFTNPTVSWTENPDLYTFTKVSPSSLVNRTSRHAPGEEISFELELGKNTVKTDRFRVYISTTCDANPYEEDLTEDSGKYTFKIPENVDTNEDVEIIIEGLKNSEDYDITFPAKQTLMNMGFRVNNASGADLGYTLNINNASKCVQDWVAPSDLDNNVKSFEQLLVIYDKDTSEEINITVTYDSRNSYEADEVKMTFAGEDVALKKTVAGNTVTLVGRFVPKKSGAVEFSGLEQYVTVRLDSNAGIKLTADAATLEKAIRVVNKDENGEAVSFIMKQNEDVTVKAEAREGFTLPSNLKIQANDGNANNLSNTDLIKNGSDWTFKTFFAEEPNNETRNKVGTPNMTGLRVNAVFPKEDIGREGEESDLFDDVQDNSKYYFDAVYWAKDNGITVGIGDNKFGVGTKLTRARAMTFLYAYAKKPANPAASKFTDIDGVAWAKDAINWAAAEGVTSGTTDTTFEPNLNVTRGMAMAFTYKVFKGTEGESSSFTDVAEGSMFYKQVSWAAKNGITSGVGNNMFGVNDEVNCEDFVTWLYKADQLGSSEAPAEETPAEEAPAESTTP